MEREYHNHKYHIIYIDSLRNSLYSKYSTESANFRQAEIIIRLLYIEQPSDVSTVEHKVIVNYKYIICQQKLNSI